MHFVYLTEIVLPLKFDKSHTLSLQGCTLVLWTKIVQAERNAKFI